MRKPANGFLLLLWLLLGLGVFSGLPLHAQNKTACELLTKANAESVLGVTLQPPQPGAPFRSLLDEDFTKGKMGEHCSFTNYVPNTASRTAARPKVVAFGLEVRYSATPDPHAVDEARKQVDQRTYDHPTDIPDLGDAAFWIGPPNNVTLFVFRGGTMRLMIGPSEIGLEKEKALALKALGGPGKTGYAYGVQPTGANKPVLTKLGPKPTEIDQLKHDLTAKADAGNAKAQLALGRLYEFGMLGADGGAKPDYAGAAYWYQKASDHGEAQAAYELAVINRDGLGRPANAPAAFELLKKAAEAGYVPAMSPLSYAYAASGSPVSAQRMTYWANRAAESGDPGGWLILGYEYNKGMLGGERPYWYRMAMDAYKKAADGGDCIAMMNIGGLYFNGNGVPQDKTKAQSWFAKAESCQGKDLDWMRAKAAKYRERAAVGHLPAVVPTGPAQGSGLTDGQKLIAGLLALTAIAMAVDIASGPSSGGDNSSGNISSPGMSSPGMDFPHSSPSAPPPRPCHQVSVANPFMTQHGTDAVSPIGATTTVCD